MGLIKDTGNTNQKLNEYLNTGLHPHIKDSTNLNFIENVVEFDVGVNDNASAEASLLFIGPATLNAYYNHSILLPLGAVQQFNYSEGQQIIKWGEIGSRIKRKAGGATEYAINLSRVITKHSNLKYAVYRWLIKAVNGSEDTSGKLSMKLLKAPSVSEGKHFVGLESELTRVEFGIYAANITAAMEILSVEVAERCTIVNGGKTISVGGALVLDNAAVDVVRVVPGITADSGSAKWIIDSTALQQQLSSFTLADYGAEVGTAAGATAVLATGP